MAIVRPRLIDFYNIPVTQEEVDFAIPFLDEDIPLYLDPFLLWKSPSQQDNALHLLLINSFNKIGIMYLKNENKRDLIVATFADLSECSEVGLGSGKTKKGMKISPKTAKEILELFSIVPQYKIGGFSHFEEIQLYVNNISKDRISDFACNLHRMNVRNIIFPLKLLRVSRFLIQRLVVLMKKNCHYHIVQRTISLLYLSQNDGYVIHLGLILTIIL